MENTLGLDTRTGLPEHLRVLADRYPRTIWHGHPNFSDLTAFWLERHLMFREVLDRMISSAETALDTAPGPRFAPDLSRYAGFFLNQLHSHHMIEDQHYFPQFSALDKRLEQAFDILDADHHALDGHLHEFSDQANAVLRTFQTGDGERNAIGRFHEVQSGFRGFLNRHLMDEEEIIVPIVLEYGEEMV